MKKYLLFALALASMSASAQVEFTIAPLSYKQIAPTKVEVSKAASKDASNTVVSDYVVPQTVEHDGVTYTVTAIGENAFKWGRAESITLPETIDTIRYGGFNTFNVPSIKLPSSLRYIGDYAFDGAKFTTLTIPEGVEEIGASAFFACKNLTSISLPKSLKVLGKSVFYNCGLTSIEIPEGIKDLPYSAFQSCSKLESVTLPADLNSIGDLAFLKCAALKSITLPSTVTSIGYEAFCNSGLETFTVPKSCTSLGSEFIANAPTTSLAVESGNTAYTLYNGAIYTLKKNILLAVPVKGITKFSVYSGCIGIQGGAFSQCEATDVTLPNGLLAIDDFAFCEAKVENINLPTSLLMIGEQAFAGTNLKSVVIPPHITYIDNAAFAQCKQLTTLTIPSSASYMAIRAFWGCTSLQSITCTGAKAPELEEAYDYDEKQFYNVPSSCTLTVPKGCTSSYKSAGWDDYFTISEGDKGVLNVASTSPADNGEVSDKYLSMSFTLKFDEDVTVAQYSPCIYLYDTDAEGNTKFITPYGDSWTAIKQGSKAVNIWGDDGDGYTDSFKVQPGHTYKLVVPEGVVKNAAGETNNYTVITFKSAQATGIDNAADDTVDATVTGVYDLSGRKISDASVKGVIIKKMSNGKSKKVLNK